MRTTNSLDYFFALFVKTFFFALLESLDQHNRGCFWPYIKFTTSFRRRRSRPRLFNLHTKGHRASDGVGLEAPRLFVAHGRTGHVVGGFISGEEDREVVALSGLGKVHGASKVNKGDVRSILSGYDPVVGLENGREFE